MLNYKWIYKNINAIRARAKYFYYDPVLITVHAT